MERESFINRTELELETIEEALRSYQRIPNIVTLRKAYESVNLLRNLIGTELKEIKTIE